MSADLPTRLRRLVLLAVLGVRGAPPALAQISLPPLAPSLASTPAPAEEKIAADPYGRETPYGCFLGFLRAARAGDDAVAAQYLQIPRLGVRQPRQELARELASVLDQRFTGNPDTLSRSRTGSLDDGLPPDQERAGTLAGGDGHVDVLLVRTRSGAAGDLWLISWDTVREARRIYGSLASAGFEKALPPFLLRTHIAAMPLWQAIVALLLLPLLYLVCWILVGVFLWGFRRLRRIPGAAGGVWPRAARRPATFLLTLLLHRAAVFWLGMPLLYRVYYNRLIGLLAVLATGWLLLRLIDALGSRLVERLFPARGINAWAIYRLGRRVLKALVVVAIAVLALAALGINLTPTLAGIGIGGLAIAFAAQKSLENIFGGLSILSDRVIRLGDVCRIGSYLGTIEDITLYATRLRTLDRTLVHIPNGALATEKIENFSRRDKFWFHHTLGLRYETTPEQLRGVLAGLRALLAGEGRVEPESARVRFLQLGAYSLDIEVFAYVRVADYNAFLEAQEELLLRIMEVVERSGTDIAFPSQTSYISRDRALGAWEAPPGVTRPGPGPAKKESPGS